MAFAALLDACVLLPYHLCDILLRLAEKGTYRVLWSAEILGRLSATSPIGSTWIQSVSHAG